MSEENVKLKSSLFDLAFAIVAVPMLVIMKGYCLFVLWGWFLVQFTGFTPSIAHCLGISLTITFFGKSPKLENDTNAYVSAFSSVIVCVLTLFVGWVFKSMM